MTLKYQQVAHDLAEKINQQVYTDKLPSEIELMDQYNVSRNTIRNALNILYSQGIIRRIQGSGYFISFSPRSDGTVLNLANKRGLRDLEADEPVLSDVLTLETISAGSQISHFLQCSEDDIVYHVRRLRHKSNAIVSLEEAFYLKSVVPYLNEEICTGSIFSFIIKTYHLEVKNGDEYVKVHQLTREEADITNLSINTPALHLEEINYLKNEQPFNYSRTLYLQKDLTLYYHVSNYLNHLQ